MGIYDITSGFADFPNKLAFTLFMPGCNLECPYCYNKEIVHAKEGSLTIGDVQQGLDASEAALRGETIGIVFSGGEPCCHPDFENFVSYFRAQKRPLSLHTNGLAPFPDVFQSVVLSVKTTADGIRDLDAYRSHMERVMRRTLYPTYKELRVVGAASASEEREETVTMLVEVAESCGWFINEIQPIRK